MNNNIYNVDNGFTLDDLPCGALVTNAEYVILDVNSYFVNELCWGRNLLVGHSIEKILTKSSKVFYQSYLIPTLLHKKHCEEMQLSIIDGNGKHISITVNAKLNVSIKKIWSTINRIWQEKRFNFTVWRRRIFNFIT